VRAQSELLWLVRFEYGLLVIAAVISMEHSGDTQFLLAYAAVFLFALAAMSLRTLRRADQDWYQCRALAESIKTLTWRYAMRAEPFKEDAQNDFRTLLRDLFRANQHIGHRIAGLNPEGEQITAEMDRVRRSSLADRKRLYLRCRIRDQRTWYAAKAKWNKRQINWWIAICVTVYVAAILSVLSKLRYPDWSVPTEPLIVAAASALGWMQIKKFSELSSAYTLAAHEIGIIETRAGAARSNDAFSGFVNEAEQAFSREHTQWIARQQQL
jgi:hypothetical protein